MADLKAAAGGYQPRAAPHLDGHAGVDVAEGEQPRATKTAPRVSVDSVTDAVTRMARRR